MGKKRPLSFLEPINQKAIYPKDQKEKELKNHQCIFLLFYDLTIDYIDTQKSQSPTSLV